MKFQNEDGGFFLSKKSQRIQDDIDLLIKRLPLLNDCFQLHTKVGKGTFSNVYLATLKNSNSTQKFAVKHLIQSCEQSRVQSEFRYLQEIGGKDNVVPAELCLSNGNDCVTFIMPYLPHLRFADYVGKMDVEETRLYMKNLFIALRRVHSFNIIHRDVKPDNFLYNRETKQFLLVDFGLAQAVITPNQEVASESCKATANVTNENLPLDYSKKRKRVSESSDDESKGSLKVTKRIALKSKDNNIKIWQTPKIPLETKAENEKRVLSVLNRGLETTKTPKANKPSPDKSNVKPRTGNSLNNSSGSRKKVIDCPEMKSPMTAGLGASKPTYENAGKFVGNVCVTPLGSTKARNGSPFYSRSNKNLWKHSTSSVGHFESPGGAAQVPPTTSSHLEPCPCSGKGAVCSLCSSRMRMDAPRAGTSGFRAPEVLFRYLYQTTAVDMWASGVVMLCILSGCYPFFNSSSDLVSLAEIMTIFGTEQTIKVASKFGRRIVCSEHRKGVDLKKLCARLRARSGNKSNSDKTYSTEVKCRDCLQTIRSDGCLCPSDEETTADVRDKQGESSDHSGGVQFPDSAFDLLRRLLDLDPTSRITAKEALEHPFITGI